MKFLFALSLLVSSFAHAELTAVGRWKTIDDGDGKPRSIVRQITRNSRRSFAVNCRAWSSIWRRPIDGSSHNENIVS